MAKSIKPGDCVRIPDGRIARVRDKHGPKYRVRVRRTTSQTHQFLMLAAGRLTKVACPKGWMTTNGYRRYLKVTLAKARKRRAKQRKNPA
jgi:hypothetical protein